MAMTLITTNTETNAASSSFTSSIDSTYKLYIFKFININPATDTADFTFNGSIDGGSNYNVTKTTTFFRASHPEDGSTYGLDYEASYDISQGTGFQQLTENQGNGADECSAGTMWLFNPSNTVYVKHFYSRIANTTGDATTYANDVFVAGYFNNTNDIDAVQFKMSSGNFDGTIKLYGVG